MRKVCPANATALLTALGVLLALLVLPVEAANPKTTFQNDLAVGSNLTVGGNLTVTGTQTQTGATTFTVAPTFSAGYIFGTANKITVNPTNPGQAVALDIPDPGGATAKFVLDTGAASIAGVKTFTSIPVFPTGGITLKGTSFNATVKAIATLAQACTYTIPDPTAATDTFATLGCPNTFTGTNTFPLAGLVFTGTSFNTTLKALNSMGQATTITIPDPGAATANVVLGTGTQTLGGTYTFSNALTLTSPLTAANIQTGSAKRELLIAKMCPAGGAVTVNGTVYFNNLCFGRAGVVKRITYMTHVDPVSGTNTIKVLKNGSAGNTMLNAASVSLNGATADVAQNATLTATGGDLTLTATDTVYCEYSAGTQGSVAKDVTAVVEFEPTDF